MEQTGAIDVYFEDEIEILMAPSVPFSAEKAKQVLKDNELEFSSIERCQA